MRTLSHVPHPLQFVGVYELARIRSLLSDVPALRPFVTLGHRKGFVKQRLLFRYREQSSYAQYLLC